MSKVNSSLKCLVALFAALLLPLCGSAGTRIAILGDIDKEKVEVDCLTQKLSACEGVELVERSAIDRILKEHGLSMGGKDDSSLKAGVLVGAQGMIVIKAFDWEGRKVLSARLVATSSGAIIDAWIQDVPSKEAGVFANAVAFRFEPLFRKLEDASRNDFLALSILSIRCPVDSLAARELERKTTLLLSQRLSCEKDFIVLERWRLSNAAWEKELNLDGNPLWTGSCLLDGAVELPDAKGIVKVALRLRFGGGRTETFEAQGPQEDLKALVENASASIRKMLGGKPEGGSVFSWNMAKEANFYLNEAEWLLRAGAYERAREAADASSALGKKGPEITFTHIKAFLGELQGARQTRIEGIIRAREAVGNNRANFRKTDAQIPQPSVANAEKLIQALDLYDKFVEAGPSPLPGEFSLDTDWRPLGAKLLEASSDLLCEIHRFRLFATDRKWNERAKLLRSMTRDAVDLTMRKGDSSYTMHAFYEAYLRSALGVISETRADYVSRFKDLMARKFPLQPRMRYEIRQHLYLYLISQPLDWDSADIQIQRARPQSELPAIAKEYELSGTPSGHVDSLIVKGRDSDPQQVDDLLWERREELLEGKGREGDCLASLLCYKYTKFTGLRLLQYAFAQDKLYDGETLAQLVSTLADAQESIHCLSSEDCRKISEAWYSYFSRMKEIDSKEAYYRCMFNASPEDSGALNTNKVRIEKDLARLSSKGQENSSQEDIPSILPSFSSPFGAKLGNSSRFSLESLLFRNGDFLAAGSVPAPNNQRGQAFLLAFNDAKSLETFAFAPETQTPAAAIPREVWNRKEPFGLMCKDGNAFLFANHEGEVFANDEGGSWRKIADTGFKVARAISSANGKLYIAYGHLDSNDSPALATMPSAIVQVDVKNGEQRIIASSRRNPPQSPLDNCKPWLPDILNCSGNNILFVRAFTVSSPRTIAMFLFTPAEGGGTLKATEIHYRNWSGEMVFFGTKGYGHSVFDSKKGELKEFSIRPISDEMEFYDSASPAYKELSLQKFCAYQGMALKLRQLDENLFALKVQNYQGDSIHSLKFRIAAETLQKQDRFLQGIELSGKRLMLAMGSAKTGLMDSASLYALDLDSLIKKEFECAKTSDLSKWIPPTLAPLQPQPPPESLKPGLRCELFNGAWAPFPDASLMTNPTAVIETNSFKTPKLNWNENAFFRFSGYFKVDREGLYTFQNSGTKIGFIIHMDEEPPIYKPTGFLRAPHVFFDAFLKPGLHKFRLDLISEYPNRSVDVVVKGPGDGKFKSVEGMVFQPKDGE